MIIRYTDEVELLNPGFNCLAAAKIAPYPMVIQGASAGFAIGKTIVCGGATMSYVECQETYEKNYHCDRNIDCTITGGGTRWCSGPKVDRCFSYNTAKNVRILFKME